MKAKHPRALLLSLPLIAAAFGARAETWFDDPLNSKKDIAPYIQNSKLKPGSCPTLPSGEHIYTLEEVVVLALCNNPDTRSAYLTLVASGYSYVQNYSDYFPTVTGSAGYTHSTAYSPHSKSITRSSGVTAAVTLYDFGQRELSIDIAEKTLLAAGNSYTSALQGAIANALKGYYSLLTSQDNVDVAEESELLAKASYDAATLKHDIGQVALADKLQAKSSYSSAVLATQSARNALAIQKAALARLMGIPPEGSVQVATLDDDNLKLQPFGEDLPRLLTEAKEKRVDLQSKRAALESSKLSLKKTRRTNLGTVTAGIDAGYDNDGLFKSTGSGSNAIGLSVSIPIFTGFTQTYNERIAQNDIALAEEDLTATELDVAQDVWNSWHNYQTSLTSWEISQDLLRSATESKDVALGRYKEGVGTILDVLTAQSQYRSALQSHTQTRFNLLTSRIDLVRSVGVLDLDTMRSTNTTPSLPPAMPEQPALTPAPAAPQDLSIPPALRPEPAPADDTTQPDDTTEPEETPEPDETTTPLLPEFPATDIMMLYEKIA